VSEGAPSGKADTTITVSDTDFLDIALGKMNPQQAFMKVCIRKRTISLKNKCLYLFFKQGKLKIQGNIMLAQKLGPLLKTEAKL
jgi:3-hydroxyacyl-CoA dehydrogenase/3a,7a,12a-trihydroxy-5b-cholest-24-enoyl-CoA hydratase